VSQNRVHPRGNRVLLDIGGETFDADIHGVTPTMLAFRMPVDCWAAGTMTVARGQMAVSAPVPLCDAGGCADRIAGSLCDDASVCTIDEQCSDDGACVAGTTLDCSGQCRTGACDAADGCVLRPDSATCDDGDACTIDDHCAGSSEACEPGAPRACVGACLSGACDPESGCTPSDLGTTCDDGNACTVDDQCNAIDGACAGGAPVSCDDGNPCTVDACDPTTGCSHTAAEDGTSCAASSACQGEGVCRAGVCDDGTSTACNDADFCTIDTCSATLGCQHTPAASTGRITCRVEEMRFILSSAPDGGGTMAAPLQRRLAKVDAAVSRAKAASSTKAARRELRRVKAALKALVGQVRRGRKKLGPVLERQIRRSADAAIDALSGLQPPLG
jgi:hypothetical protein